jgi:hypothetical protein
MQLPALPNGIDGRTWIMGIFVTRLPRILMTLAVLVSTCDPHQRESLRSRGAPGASPRGGGRQQAACCISSLDEGTSSAPGATVTPTTASPMPANPR